MIWRLARPRRCATALEVLVLVGRQAIACSFGCRRRLVLWVFGVDYGLSSGGSDRVSGVVACVGGSAVAGGCGCGSGWGGPLHAFWRSSRQVWQTDLLDVSVIGLYSVHMKHRHFTSVRKSGGA